MTLPPSRPRPSRSRRPARRIAVLVAGAVLAALGATTVAVTQDVPAQASSSGPGVERRTETTQVQRVRVRWDGSRRRQVYQKTAVIPGIGDLDLICKPRKQMVRLYTANRSLETQMWLQKYEIKNGREVVAVKTPRIYRYAHADDDGTGGTGFYAHEGLNQKPGVENRSQDGYMYGVISQRPGRHQSGSALTPLRPVTTFELSWFWNGFDFDQEYRSCTIDATFTTQFPASSRSSLTWHGTDDPAPTEVTSTIPGVGQLTLSCPHDRGLDPTVALAPLSSDASLYLEDVTAEGLVDDHVVTTSLGYDQETGLVGPYPLPQNGTLRMLARQGTAESWVMLSSYVVRNDLLGPQRNVCELASGYYSR